MNDVLPAPIDGGRLAQTLVAYCGRKTGGFSIKGSASHRSYRFAQSPTDRIRWVLAQDLDRFRLLAEFEVLDVHAVDPERDERRGLRERLDVLERSLAERDLLAAQPRLRRGGRPPVPKALTAREWHLHHHCGWSWREVAEEAGVNGQTSEAAVQARAARWAKRNPSAALTSSCELCLNEDCPPTKE